VKIRIGNINFTEIFIADFCVCFILGFIKNTSNRQVGGCCGCPNQRTQKRRVCKRDTLLILGDERKKTALNFVPFACTGRVMQHCCFLLDFISRPLKLVFPQPVSTTVTAAAVRSDEVSPPK
jgi:hypothetical protein